MSIKKPQSGYVGVTTHQPLIEPQGSFLDPLVNLTKCCRKSFTSVCPKCPNNLPSVLRVQRYPLSKLHPSMTAAGIDIPFSQEVRLAARLRDLQEEQRAHLHGTLVLFQHGRFLC